MECESVAVRGGQRASHGQPWDDDPPLRMGACPGGSAGLIPRDQPGCHASVATARPRWAARSLPQPIDSMFRSTTSMVLASSSVGWNSTTSVPAKISGRCPGRA